MIIKWLICSQIKDWYINQANPFIFFRINVYRSQCTFGNDRTVPKLRAVSVSHENPSAYGFECLDLKIVLLMLESLAGTETSSATALTGATAAPTGHKLHSQKT